MLAKQPPRQGAGQLRAGQRNPLPHSELRRFAAPAE
jgi:hypothetical protein